MIFSGHFSPVLITFGVFSAALVVLCANRLVIIDDESLPISLIIGLIKYFPWLLGQIILSGISVSLRILNPKLPINPSIIRVQVPYNHIVTKVTFANSITLTPGTVSLELTNDYVEVHALSETDSENLANGQMNKKVLEIEVNK